MMDEDRGGDQLLGAGERAVGFGEPALHRPVGGGIADRRVRLDPEVPAAEDRGDGGEQVGVARADQPGARSAHRFAGQIGAVGVDAQPPLRFLEAVEHVVLADPAILGVGPAVRLDPDDVPALGLLVMAFVDVPEADVGRVLRVEAVQVDHGRPGPGRIIVRRQVGAAELGRAVDPVDPGQADEAGRTDLRRVSRFELGRFHQGGADHARLETDRREVGAGTVGHQGAEHPPVTARAVVAGRGGGAFEQAAGGGRRIALVPGQPGDQRRAERIGRADPEFVGTVGPAAGVEGDRRGAARPFALLDQAPARREGGNLRGAVPRPEVGVDMEPARRLGEEGRERLRHRLAGREQADRQPRRTGDLLGAEQDPVGALAEPHRQADAVAGERGVGRDLADILAIDPDVHRHRGADRDLGRSRLGAVDRCRRIEIMRPRIGIRRRARRGLAFRRAQLDHVGPGRVGRSSRPGPARRRQRRLVGERGRRGLDQPGAQRPAPARNPEVALGVAQRLAARVGRRRRRRLAERRQRQRSGEEDEERRPQPPAHRATAVTSISTSQPGSTSPATCMVERAGLRGCAAVPKNSR